MKTGDDDSGGRMRTDRGTGLAALVSPDASAETERDPDNRNRYGDLRQLFRLDAATEITRRTPPPEVDWPEASEAAELAVEVQLRRMLTGLEHLPRRDRLHANRAARAWRRAALKTVRERRATERHAARMLRRAQNPAPT